MNPQQQQYDDDQVSEPNIRPQLGVVPGGGETSEPRRGHLSSVPDSSAPSGDGTAESSGKLRALEGGGESSPRTGKLAAVNSDVPKKNASLGDQEADPGGKSFFTGGKKGKKKFGGKLLDKLGSKKVLLIGAGSGVLVVGIVIIALLVLASSMKVVDVAQNITSYEFARVTRQFSKAAGRTAESALAVEATDDATHGGLKAKFTEVKGSVREATWGKLDNVRPGQVAKTLGTDSGLKLNFTQSKLTGRSIFTSATIDGVDYPIKQLSGISKWVPGIQGIVEAKNKAAFYKAFAPALQESLDATNTGGIVRGLVASKLRSQIGIGLSGYALEKFQGKDAKAARLEEARQKAAAVNDTAKIPDNAQTAEIKNADKDAAAAEAETLKDPVALQAAINNDGTPPKVVASITKDISPSLTSQALDFANPIYAVITPICIVFDGSLQNSAGTINNQTNQQQASYYQLASVADQQKNGPLKNSDGTALANAIGATNDDLGNVSQTIPQQRAAGADVNTNGAISAEAAASGSYSLVNLAGVSGAPATFINAIASKFCGVLTSTGAGATIGVANVGLAISTLGGSEAVQEAAGQGATQVIKAYLKTISQRVFGSVAKEVGLKTVKTTFVGRARKFIFQQAAIAGGTFGATELAKLIVSSRSNQMNSGLAQGQDHVEQADSGGNIAANDINRQQLYGRPMTQTEVVASNTEDLSFIQHQNSQKSAFERYFATDNAYSLLSRVASGVAAEFSGSIPQSMVNLATSLMKPATMFSSLATSFSGKANAAALVDQHYGNVQFGWSGNEEALIDSSDSYLPLQNAQTLDDELAAKNISSKDIEGYYGTCFTGTIGDLLSSGDITRDDSGNVDASKGLCAPNNLGPTNSDSSAPCGSGGCGDIVFRWRLSKQYDSTLNQLTDEQQVGP